MGNKTPLAGRRGLAAPRAPERARFGLSDFNADNRDAGAQRLTPGPLRFDHARADDAQDRAADPATLSRYRTRTDRPQAAATPVRSPVRSFEKKGAW